MKKFLLNLFSHNSLFYLKIDLHFLYVRMLNFIFFKTTKNTKPNASFLNIGCGSHGLDSNKWFNLDGWSAEGLDYQSDLRRNLPFEDSRFNGIYSEHFVEHLSSEEVKDFLNECFRILTSNGAIRLIVPDGELYLRNYFKNREWMLNEIKNSGWMFEPQRKHRTPMELVNDVFRQKLQHQYCYDFETISLLLSESGFENIRRVAFGSGFCEELQID